MNAALVCLAGLVVFALGYRYYSRFMAEKVLLVRDDEPMPAIENEDGIDFVPTNKHVLFGHHYSSIAGAAPIIGPAIAVVWGWVPALIWVVLGTVFMGAVHDMSTLIISVRHGGKSIGGIVESVIGPRTRNLYLLVIFALITLVIAVFAKAIATLFVSTPGSVLPINFEIIVAIAIGWLCYKRNARMLWPSIAALVSLYAMVWVGVKVPLSLDGIVGADNAQMTWIVLLLIYSLVASVLPVWVLLQPRDYINSHQLLVGLLALIAGLIVASPEITAPAFNTPPDDAPSWFPFLFVTVACGAISGFHGLVSSGTTSKQLCKASDARFVGYGAALGEGTLALIATLAVAAGLGDWGGHYHSFAAAQKGAVSSFVEGAGSFLIALGIDRGPANVVVAVLVISFAATSLDTGVRIQRYIIQELAASWRISALQNRYAAALLAVTLPLLLIVGGKAGQLWPLFGASNQLLAGLSLTVVTVWQFRSGRPWLPIAIPLGIVFTVATFAMSVDVARYVGESKYLLAFIGSVILSLQLWVLGEGVVAMRNAKR